MRRTHGRSAFEELHRLDPERAGVAGSLDAGWEAAEPAGVAGPTAAPAERLLAEVLATPTDDRGLVPQDSARGRDGLGAPTSPGRPRRDRWDRRWQRRSWPVVTAVLAGAVAVLLAVAFLPPPGEAPQKAHPSATGHVSTQTPTAHSPRWRLVAALQGAQFQLGSGNPTNVAGVRCATLTLCFLETGYGLDYNQGSLSVSTDGGHTWSQVTLPPDTAPTTRVSCPTPTWCAVGAGKLDPATGDPLAGKPSRDPELLVSTDQGATWSVQPVPLPVGVVQIPASGRFPAETTRWPGAIDDLACSAPDSCSVIAEAENPSRGAGDNELVFARTTDGGAHWTSTVLPERKSETGGQIPMAAGTDVSMACPSATECVVVAAFVSIGQHASTWTTTDAGVSWSESPVPGVGTPRAPISCPDQQDCWLLGGSSDVLFHSADMGATWSPVQLPTTTVDAGSQPVPGGWDAVSCSSATTCWIAGSGIQMTDDGGATWQAVPLPTGTNPPLGPVLQISCNTEQACAAVAQAGGIPEAENWGSLILTSSPSG